MVLDLSTDGGWYRVGGAKFTIRGIANFLLILEGVKPIVQPLPSKKKIITRSLSWTPWSLARTILSLLRFIENQLILDFYSHHEKRHKISAAETLLYRATNLPNTKQGKETERNHVTDSLRFNYYPQKAISNILKRKYLLLSVQTPSQHLGNLFACFSNGPHPPISLIMQSSLILMEFLSL